MTRKIYVNGRYQPYGEASIHVEDRGYQFADAIYEVCEVRGGHMVDETRHLDRLERSLDELAIPRPMSRAALGHVMRETIRRNRVRDGLVYLQVSRGAGPREFLFPPAGTRPSVVCLARVIKRAAAEAKARNGVAVKSVSDNRWGRCDIKTVMLLPACLAKEAARSEGAGEAWFIDEGGFVTEGASSNAWIVTADGRCVTRPADQAILRGVTRTTLIDLLAREGIALEERAFTLVEAKAAREAFITSASSIVLPVVRIDGDAVGDGTPGPVARALRAGFHEVAEVASVAPHVHR